MARELIELGAVELLELGSFREPQSFVSGAAAQLYDMVSTFEDPLAALDVHHSELPQDALETVNRIRMLSRRARFEIIRPPGLGEFSALGELHEITLGKKKKHGIMRLHDAIHKKVMKVVKSPAFLTVAGIVVNVIPGVGQVASAGLMAAAAARTGYEQQQKQKKAVKQAKAADIAAQQQYAQQIVDYNKKTQAYYAAQGTQPPPGSYLDANGQPTDDPTKAPGLTASGQPASAPKPTFDLPVPASAKKLSAADQQVAQAAALSAAMALDNGQGAAGVSAILNDLPPDIAQAAAQEVPAAQKDVKDPAFRATALKSVGQFVAVHEMAMGTGVTTLTTPEEMELTRQILANATPEVERAIAAGEQDLITSGAANGQAETIQAAIAKGKAALKGGIPWGTIALVGGGVAAVGLVAVLVL
jgi:hypothetical protein